MNTVLRVVLDDGAAFAVCVFAGGPAALERTCAAIACVGDAVSAPAIIVADVSGEVGPHPYVVYPWIDGITLDEFRKQTDRARLLGTAAPLGACLARLSQRRPPADWPVRSIASMLAKADRELGEAITQHRMGAALAADLRALLAEWKPVLLTHDQPDGLVHGDFGGRNILVSPIDATPTIIVGILDWETATVGSPLWDIGSLFSYASRYSPEFCAAFAAGYRAEAADLPEDWWRLARLLDAAKTVGVFLTSHDLPVVFQECRTILETVVTDCVVV